VSSLRSRARELDEACADAVDLARAAAEQEAGPGLVGQHLGVEPDGDRVCTHLFACLDPAYEGWRWAVTVARASRSKTVTVSESLLLPGPDSLLAPDWVPWRDRVRPGDLGVGDLLPAHADDDRLVPAAVLEGDGGVLDWDDSPAWAQSLSAPPRTRARPESPRPGARERRRSTPRDATSTWRRDRRASCPRSAATRPPCGGTTATTARAALWRTPRRARA
jgi:hypothetical protein